MKITAKQNARKWTKERLKRHPGAWRIEQEAQIVPCWPGEIAVRIQNLIDGWSGWFPVKDIEIHESTLENAKHDKRRSNSKDSESFEKSHDGDE